MKTVGALIFPGFELLDVYGPLEMFGLHPDRFDIRMVAETAEPVTSNQGPRSAVDDIIAEGRPYDIILIPGGRGTRTEIDNPAIKGWITETSKTATLSLGVCTGAALMARAGILDGKRATTNRAAFQWVADQGPNVGWVRAARWVEDGNIFTASGVSAGMDQALAVIARLLGVETARETAFWAEYEWHEDAGWDPFAAAHGLIENGEPHD